MFALCPHSFRSPWPPFPLHKTTGKEASLDFVVVPFPPCRIPQAPSACEARGRSSLVSWYVSLYGGVCVLGGLSAGSQGGCGSERERGWEFG
jgi:hypothetical protein